MKNKEERNNGFGELTDELLDEVSGGTGETVPGVAETFGDMRSTGIGGIGGTNDVPGIPEISGSENDMPTGENGGSGKTEIPGIPDIIGDMRSTGIGGRNA